MNRWSVPIGSFHPVVTVPTATSGRSASLRPSAAQPGSGTSLATPAGTRSEAGAGAGVVTPGFSGGVPFLPDDFMDGPITRPDFLTGGGFVLARVPVLTGRISWKCCSACLPAVGRGHQPIRRVDRGGPVAGRRPGEDPVADRHHPAVG